MYVRLEKEDIENQETRALILGYIIGNPGAHYSKIKKELNLKNGTYDYHLNVLLREKKIKKRNTGMKVRFFPQEFNIGDLSQYENITNKEKKYLLYLRENNLSTVKQIARYFKTSPNNVYPTIKNLRAKEFVFYKEEGRISKQPITLTYKGEEELNNLMENLIGNEED